jgi:hypothetical protein
LNFITTLTYTTLPVSGNIDFVFRRQDANNYWVMRVAPDGTLRYIEVIAGVENNRGSSAAGYVTNGTRITLVLDGTQMRVWKNHAQGLYYGSVSNFAASTAGRFVVPSGAVVSNAYVHYRDLPASFMQHVTAS